jgi:UDP-N-acetylmuramate--alanine ligase
LSGINIHFEDRIDLIPEEFYPENTLVIVTPAVLKHIHSGITFRENFIKRAEVLGIITKDTFCFAVAGTQNDNSSILGHILLNLLIPLL